LTGLSTGAVQMVLVEMELAGEVLRHAGGRVGLVV
jgi:predicted Rossmann fold nucleotide-binding protein DprA/Smf involved in DNA uptake